LDPLLPLLLFARIARSAVGHGNALLSEVLDHGRQEREPPDGHYNSCMESVRCANCQSLQRRVRDLQAENERLRHQLDEATRAGKRQAAPFAKGEPKPAPRKPGRKPGKDYGTKAYRQPPSPEEINEIHEAPLPDRCPGCGGTLDETHIAQQFQVARQVLSHGMMPIIEPEVNIKSADRAESDQLLLNAILKELDNIADGQRVMLKLSIPERPGLFQPLVEHPKVLRVVALSGGFSREEASRELAKNPGMIASFSRALLSDLRAQQSDEEFNRTLGTAIDEIYEASTKKVPA